MKKFKVLFNNGIKTDVFKVLAKNKKDAVRIFYGCRSPYYKVVQVIEVKDTTRKHYSELWIVIACALISILIVTLASSCSTWNKPQPVSYERYIVDEGDSLWTIGINSNGWNIIDNTYIIEDIQMYSDCTSVIYPGQVVYIPMYDLD